MRRLVGLALALALVGLAFSTLAFSQGWSVFVNNKAFKGKVTGKPASFWLEAGALAKMTSIGLKIDEAAREATLNGEKLPTQVEGDLIYLEAMELMKRLGGKYTVNQQMQSVDIYLGGAGQKVSAAGGGIGSVTSVDLNSVPGEYICGGRSRHYTEENATITVGFAYGKPEGGISVRVVSKTDSEDFHIELGAPGKKLLKVGVYENAVRFPFNQGEQAGLNCSGSGRGNNQLTGRFEILDIGYGAKGPSHLAANLVQYGEGNRSAPLEGFIRYRTTIPRP